MQMGTELISGFEVYLIFMADKISAAATWAATVSAVVAACSFLIYGSEKFGEVPVIRRLARFAAIVFCICGPLAMFVPKTDTAVKMVIVPAIANNKHVQQIPQRILSFIDSSLGKLQEKITGSTNK